jgi:hypothetical protein
VPRGSRTRAVRRLAAACLALLLGAGALVGAAAIAGAATPVKPKRPTAAAAKAPIYEFLRKSGFSKRARPESAVVQGVITVQRGGRTVVTSTTRAVHKKEILDAIQVAIVNGTLVEEATESTKVGTLEVTYSDGNSLTVTIYNHYYEITASAGTIHFTSEPLTTILWELLK